MMFEDVAVGDAADLGSHLFTAEEIKRFADRYDPQPFHIDEAAARQSHFGGLVASGWHVAAIWMRLMVAWRARQVEALLAAGRPAGEPGPSPGFRDMAWLQPVRAGDRLHYRTEVTGKKDSASHPGWGLVLTRNSAANPAGEAVFRFDGAVFWQRRTPLP